MTQPHIAPLLFATLMLAAASSHADDVKSDIKETGRAIGHTTRDVTKEIGHASRDAANGIGHATREVTRDIGHGTRDLVDDIKGEKSKSKK